jgi:hypothetical protein
MEHRVLLPALRGARANGLATRLELEHQALAALLVPTPTPSLVRALRAILQAHDGRGQGPDGLSAACARLASGEADALLAAARAVPPVPVAAHADGPWVAGALRRALLRVGYALTDYDADSDAGVDSAVR